jgi:acylphosphatase
MKHVNITVTGRVQGVGFRYSARSYARQSGIKGFVRNTFDNKVYIEAEGDEKQLKEFINWCHNGPANANVEYVSVIPGAIQGFDGFEVKF